MSDTVTKLDSDSAATMHHDHRRWESDVSMWRDDIDNWKDEHREAFRELKRIESQLHEHEASLESHCNSIDSHQAHTLQHEHDIATDCRNQNALNQQAADEHAKEAEAHQRLADAHERMKKHHHTVMAHVAMLKSDLGRRGLAAQRVSPKTYRSIHVIRGFDGATRDGEGGKVT